VVIEIDRHRYRLSILPPEREREKGRMPRELGRCARTWRRTPCARRLKIRHGFGVAGQNMGKTTSLSAAEEADNPAMLRRRRPMVSG
jgi:hypothetical protein